MTYKSQTGKLSWLGLYNTPSSSLQSRKTPNECPGYETKQSGGESPVLEFGGVRSIHSLPLSQNLQ